jgi:hypothetical protein
LGVAAVIAFAVGFAAGAVLLFVLHLQHWLPGSQTRQLEAFSQVPEPQAGDLAERFRPWLLFDSGELWRPLNVSYLFDEGTLKFCTRLPGKASCTPIPNAAAFA